MGLTARIFWAWALYQRTFKSYRRRALAFPFRHMDGDDGVKRNDYNDFDVRKVSTRDRKALLDL